MSRIERSEPVAAGAGSATASSGAGSAVSPTPRISGTEAKISAMPPVAVSAAVVMPSSLSRGSPTQMAANTKIAALTNSPIESRRCSASRNWATIGR